MPLASIASYAAWLALVCLPLVAATTAFGSTPARIVQTLLRESDVEGYEPARVVAYLQAVQADCVVINGGGVVDFFPFDDPMARPTAALGKRDLVRELTAACHRVGIRVMARVDFRGVDEARWRRHPDWFSVDGAGQPVREGALFRTCFNSAYRNDYGLRLIRHLLETSQVDGIWYNAPQAHGACYCAACAQRYRAATGRPIPSTGATDAEFLAPAMREYRALKAHWGDEHFARVRAAIKAAGAERMLAVEIFGMFGGTATSLGGIDVLTMSPHVDFLLGKAFVEDSDEPAYPGSTIRLLKALAPDKPAVLLTSVHRNKFRLVAEDPVKAEAWLWEAVAAGGGLWNTFVAGAEPDGFADHRNARTFAPVFSLLQSAPAEFAARQPAIEAGIFYAKASRDRPAQNWAAAVQGAERVLVQNHVPVGFFPSVNFSREALGGTKLLLLPAGTALADGEIAVIENFVAAGGCVIAECDASLFDGRGEPRAEFGLAKVLGVSFAGRMVENTRNSPHQIRERHEILRDWDATELLLNGGRMALCRAKGATALATWIPAPPAGVPEESWLRVKNTADVTIAVHPYGRGTAIYFAHEIMRLAREDGHPDFAGLLASAVSFCLGRRWLETDAPPEVHTALLTDGAGRYTLSFVNHTAGAAWPRQARPPVNDIAATLRMSGLRLKGWRALTDPSVLRVVENGDGSVAVHVSRLGAFAAVALTLADDGTR